MRKILTLALSCFALAFATGAYAKDMNGHLGLGVDNNITGATLGFSSVKSSSNSVNAPSSGLSLKYWINSDWAIAGVLGFMYAGSGAIEEEDGTLAKDKSSIWGLSFDLKGIYNFAKSENANLGAFATFSLRKENGSNARPSGAYHSNLGFAMAIGLTPEVFLTDNFALTAEFGLIFRLQHGAGFGIGGDNMLGGLGFHYYF